MKRITFIETAVLITALVCGYQAFNSMIQAVVSVVYFDLGDELMGFVIRYLVYTCVYFGLFYLLVRKGHTIADYIHRQWQSGREVEDRVDITVHRNSALFIALVVLSLVMLVQEIPHAIAGVIDYYRRNSGGFNVWDRTGTDINFKMAAIRILVSVLLLFFARPISNWFGNLPGNGTVVIDMEKKD